MAHFPPRKGPLLKHGFDGGGRPRGFDLWVIEIGMIFYATDFVLTCLLLRRYKLGTNLMMTREVLQLVQFPVTCSMSNSYPKNRPYGRMASRDFVPMPRFPSPRFPPQAMHAHPRFDAQPIYGYGNLPVRSITGMQRPRASYFQYMPPRNRPPMNSRVSRPYARPPARSKPKMPVDEQPAKAKKKKSQKKAKVAKEMTFVEPERTSGTVDDFASAGASVATASIAPLYSTPHRPAVPQHVADKLNDNFTKIFLLKTTVEQEVPQTPAIVDKERRSEIADSGLLGACMHVEIEKASNGIINAMKMDAIADSNIYLNVHSPFCAVITGVQGSGKSHTMAVMLENCLLACPLPPASPLVQLRKPLSALVLHYDRVDTNICEATGLAHPSMLMRRWIAGAGGEEAGLPAPPAIQKIVVLVSPTFYTQRRAFYANDERYDVRPLLFRWSSLDAVTLKKLMRIDEFGTQVADGHHHVTLRLCPHSIVSHPTLTRTFYAHILLMDLYLLLIPLSVCNHYSA